jgi:hypothetical protein
VIQQRARTCIVACAAVLAAGCTATKPRGEDGKQGPGRADADPQSGGKRWTARARTHLLLEQHENTSAKARYLGVDLSGPAPTLLSTMDGVALAMDNWPEHFETVVGHDRSEHWVTPEIAEGGLALARMRVTGERDGLWPTAA